MTDKALIALLADGEFHSGEKLGDQLDISRAAVWKQLQKLENLGVAVESVKGLGYRIPGGIDLLRKDAILAAMGPAKNVCRLTLLSDAVSTNDWVKAQAGSWHGITCLAERQTGGRGRRGRVWVSPYGRNLYLSMGWQFEGGAAALEGLSLAVGVAVCQALGGFEAHRGIALKWPNDILLDGRKLAGVLVEMQGDPVGTCQVVVGIGVNYGMSATEGKAIDQPWADGRTVTTVGRSRLAGDLIRELVAALTRFSEHGFAAFREDWSGHDVTRDKPVTVTMVNRSVEGVARGINDTGALLVETAGGTETFHGGEVSLRVTE